MKDRDVRSLTADEKAAALKAVGAELAKLEREYGPAVVRWAVNRRQEQRAEKARLGKEKAELERRLAEIESGD